MKRSTFAAVLCGFATMSVAVSACVPPTGAKPTAAKMAVTKSHTVKLAAARTAIAQATASATKPACCQLHGAEASSGNAATIRTVATTGKAAPKSNSKSTKAAPKKKTPAQLREEKLDALWKQSDKAYHAGDYTRAVSFHRQIVAIDPTDVEAYSNAAWLLWSMGKGNDALAFLQKGIKANPKNADMWEALGNHYGTFLKRHREAQVAYTRAVQYSPRGANTQMLRRRLAHAAEGAGDLQTSLATWRALVRDYPNIPVNRNNLARVEKLMKKGSVSA